MPSSAFALQASMIGCAVRKSISATHRGMTSAVPNFLTRSSYLEERLWLRSMTSSKLYFIRDSFAWLTQDRLSRRPPGCPCLCLYYTQDLPRCPMYRNLSGGNNLDEKFLQSGNS